MTSRNATTGDVRGYLVDVLLEIAPKLGIEHSDIDFVETTWETFALGLDQRKYDLSIAGTFQTPARAAIVDFTLPLGYLGNGVLVRRDDRRFETLRDIKELDNADLTLAVVSGEQGHEYALRELPLARPRLRVLGGSDLSLVCIEVAMRRADAALSDQYITNRCLREQPTLRDPFQSEPYHVLPISWATRKGDDRLRSQLNLQITQLESTGWLRRHRSQYPAVPWAAPSTGALLGPVDRRIREYSKAFLWGIACTIGVSAGAIAIGTILGVLIGIFISRAHTSALARFVAGASRAYVYSALAVPALALILIVYYNRYTTYLTATTAAILALALNLAPFIAKIVSAAIQNIDPKYLEAAEAFGFSARQIDRRFRLPLASRGSMQPVIVEWITTIKLSSLASIIGVTEILYQSQQVIRETYLTGEVYAVLVFCYMCIVIPLSLIGDYYDYLSKRDREPQG